MANCKGFIFLLIEFYVFTNCIRSSKMLDGLRFVNNILYIYYFAFNSIFKVVIKLC